MPMLAIADNNAPIGAIRLQYICNSRTPLLIVDDFHPEPDSLVSLADCEMHSESAGLEPVPGHYPAFLHRTLPAIFWLAGLDNQEFTLRDARFCHPSAESARPSNAKSTASPGVNESDEWIMIHYLFDNPQDGTAFYRNKIAGLNQRLDKEHVRISRSDLALHTTESGVISHPTQPLATQFEQTDKIDAIFNRAIFFPARAVYSDSLPANRYAAHDDTTGRLTATCRIGISK